MDMKNLRWGLGAALVLASLISAARALGAYVGHGLWLGSASVLLLAVIALVGYASLWRARRRIGDELAGLSAEPPRGELIARRRAQLVALAARGVQPDRDALAAASEAEERGRAYLGRYFVAVTVLVGLVGTFAGLMETLRTLGPLVTDGSTLQLLQAPLAGLDVTFGASVVGILVTLALALVQGDLVLAEELALTRLEERTTHVLVPEIWPPAQAPGERTVDELVALRKDVERLGVEAGERAAAQLGQVTRAVMDTLVAELGRGVAAVQASLEKTSRASLEALAESTQQHADAMTSATKTNGAAMDKLVASLEKSAQAHAAAMATSTQQHADALTSATKTNGAAMDKLVASLDKSAQQHADALTSAANKHGASLVKMTGAQLEALAESLQKSHAAIDALARVQMDALAKSAQQHADALAQSSEATAAALRGSLVEAGARLEATSQSLAQAVDGLRVVSDALSPRLADLTPELNALAREVSLLAARADGDDPLITDELVRLGEGFDRLETLLRMSQA
jgi:hypothetical protein